MTPVRFMTEGGNIFKDENKVPVTQRINKADVDPTLKWLEKIIKIDLVNNKLGSTGLTPDSGDLDVAVDQSKVSKDDLVNSLVAWVHSKRKGDDPKNWIRKSGISVHFKTPIRGDEANGFVQTDLMFGEPEWMKFAMQGAANSKFKGMHRHILMASIAKALGLKWSGQAGVTSRESGKVISKDPDHIAEILLGPGNTADQFASVELMIAAIRHHDNYEELIGQAREHFERDGLHLPFNEDIEYDDELGRMLEMAGVKSPSDDPLFVQLPNAEYRGRVGGPKMADRVPPKHWPNMVTGK